jgi:uncharacterized protein (TIGR03790 family)
LPRALAPLALLALWLCAAAHPEVLTAARLGVVYNLDEPGSRELATYYATRRSIPSENLIGLHLADQEVIDPGQFAPLRSLALDQLPAAVQSLALVWSKPYAVGCMSITTAFAAGYRAAFCEPGCALTAPNPLFDTAGWLPTDTVGWWPAMLLPANDAQLARAIIDRGIAADGSRPDGTLYLVRTQDAARNVRARTYPDVHRKLDARLRVVELTLPAPQVIPAVIGYFTGGARVDELARIDFRPGAVADHLTSTGGVLFRGDQMSALAWLRQGATGSYGSVSEPCNHPEKFPSAGIFFDHYLRGDTLLEAYWKSVAMPGQGLFIGEPLARPYAPKLNISRHSTAPGARHVTRLQYDHGIKAASRIGLLSRPARIRHAWSGE